MHRVSMNPGQVEWGIPPSVLSATQSAESNASPKPADSAAPVPRLQCPFLQKDLDTYGQCSSCNGKGFETLPRLMEHIRKHHVGPHNPTSIDTTEQLNDKSKRRAKRLQEQKVVEETMEKEKKEQKEREKKQKEREKREKEKDGKSKGMVEVDGEDNTRKKHGCPKTLSSQRYYELFEKREQTATKDSLREAWLEIYRLIFPDDNGCPPNPYKPYMEQFTYHVRHPSPGFLAWCEKHHTEDCSVQAKLVLSAEIVDWLSETGGFPSDPTAPCPSYAVLPERSRAPAHLETPGRTQPLYEDTNANDGDLVMQDNEEVMGDNGKYLCEEDNSLGLFADMATMIRTPSPNV